MKYRRRTVYVRDAVWELFRRSKPDTMGMQDVSEGALYLFSVLDEEAKKRAVGEAWTWLEAPEDERPLVKGDARRRWSPGYLQSAIEDLEGLADRCRQEGRLDRAATILEGLRVLIDRMAGRQDALPGIGLPSLVGIRMQEGDWAAADALASRIIDASHRDRDAHWLQWGLSARSKALRKLGRDREADQVLEQALQTGPELPGSKPYKAKPPARRRKGQS